MVEHHSETSPCTKSNMFGPYFTVPCMTQPGKLLGSQGASIRAIRENTGASIRLEPNLKSVGDCGGAIEGVDATDRLLTIGGSHDAVLAGLAECVTKLMQSQVGFALSLGSVPVWCSSTKNKWGFCR
jgi:hypothetical protein